MASHCEKYGIDPNERMNRSKLERLSFPEGENNPKG
jgi:hypothetical protein